MLEHPAPLAWWLPGQAGPVIVSTAALDRLDPEGLRAVLAHERAHQASRHHALLLVAEALRVGCPWLPAPGWPASTSPAWSSWPSTTPPPAGAAARHSPCWAAHPPPRRPRRRRRPPIGTHGPAPVPPEPGGHTALAAAVAVVVLPLLVQVGAVAEPVARVAGAALCPLP